MFGIYLVDSISSNKGYYKGTVGRKKTAMGVSKICLEIRLTVTVEKTYKTYDRAERQCSAIQQQAREASGVDRNTYNIYIVDLSSGQYKQIIQADI